MDFETLNTVNDVDASVVETQTEPAEGLSEMAEQGGATAQEAEFTPRPQSRQENARFRKLRLENEQLRQENEQFATAAIARQMEDDLAAIRVLDPTVATLEELGDEFAELIAAGISAPVAFAALKEAKRAALPPTMGAVNGENGGEKTFYSPAEVDALTPEQLADPAVWSRVRASMTKWK